MQFDKILGLVQDRANLPSGEEAFRATRATLSTLNERLAGGETGDLAAQLPMELQQYLDDKGKGEKFGLDEFFERVSRVEGVDVPQSIHHVRAVISVLKEAVSAGEMDDIMGQLPEEYKPLFESGHEGSLNA